MSPVRAEPEPSFAIELGHHRTPIKQLAVDALGQVLVTTDGQPSLRSWDLLSGTLLKTIHLPSSGAQSQSIRALDARASSRQLAVVTERQEPSGKTQVALLIIDRLSGAVAKTLLLESSATSVLFNPEGTPPCL